MSNQSDVREKVRAGLPVANPAKAIVDNVAGKGINADLKKSGWDEDERRVIDQAFAVMHVAGGPLYEIEAGMISEYFNTGIIPEMISHG